MEVLQAVLLFGSKTWVLTPWWEKSLEGFHHQAYWGIAGVVPKRQWDKTWMYPPIGGALEIVVLEEIRVYIACRQNIFAQYIFTCPIIELCLVVEWNPVMRQSR